MHVRNHQRRLAFIGLAAFLVLAGWWLSRPHIDPRFVGKWTVQDRSADNSWPVPSVEFRADGNATWWSSSVPQNRIYSPSPVRWSMSGKRLVWRHEYESLTEAIDREYDRLRYRFWDRNAVAPHEHVFEIVDVSNGEIQVDAIAVGKTKLRWVLRRAE